MEENEHNANQSFCFREPVQSVNKIYREKKPLNHILNIFSFIIAGGGKAHYIWMPPAIKWKWPLLEMEIVKCNIPF
ncbi:MAG: hypothetical protein ATN36_03880 [Epulopiscium sp. Nele67-Bin005]|nr:MAG: hypothetical protein ATN36_03880 [Epulopiscium sp. Nele67-Bin005]